MLRFFRQAVFKTTMIDLALIVLGILIALGIDQWMQERKSHALAQEYKAAIVKALETDIAELNSILTEIAVRKAAVGRLKQYTVATLPTDIVSQQNYLKDIDVAGYFRVFTPNRTAIDDLISTGNLRLIKDFSIRSKLLNYYEQVADDAPYAHWSRQLIWEKFRYESSQFLPLPLVDLYSQIIKGGQLTAPFDVTLLQRFFDHPDYRYGLFNSDNMADFQQAFAERHKALALELKASFE